MSVKQSRRHGRRRAEQGAPRLPGQLAQARRRRRVGAGAGTGAQAGAPATPAAEGPIRQAVATTAAAAAIAPRSGRAGCNTRLQTGVRKCAAQNRRMRTRLSIAGC